LKYLFNNQIEYHKDSPMYQATQQPQLMYAKFPGRSSFFRNKQLNLRITENWNKLRKRRK